MRLYTQGAYIAPMQSISGKWCWQVVEFDLDTYSYDAGGEVFNPTVVADTKEELTADRMAAKVLEREG